ncbi:MAG: class I SAM-dependent methyltransferase [Geminicoccaceae bacterium]
MVDELLVWVFFMGHWIMLSKHDSALPVEQIIGWDVETWSRALATFDKVLAKDLSGTRSLELGARGGGLSLWLAMRGSEVTCSCYGCEPSDAVQLHQEFGVQHNVRYETIDATDIPYEDTFDIIVLKSVIGGIGAGKRVDRERAALAQIHRALREDGVFLFAENVMATKLHQMLRRVKRGDRWHYSSIEEMRSLFGDFSKLSYETTGFLACLGYTERQRRWLGRIDAVLCRFVPANWHYVMMGAAIK